MNSSHREIIELLVLLIVCGIAAYMLMRHFRGVGKAAKDAKTLPDFVGRMLDLLEERRVENANRFGSPRRTVVIVLVNTILLIGWCYTALISPFLFYGIFIYVIVGLFVIRGFAMSKTIPFERLGFTDRLWVKIFYAWLWPVYLWRANVKNAG